MLKKAKRKGDSNIDDDESDTSSPDDHESINGFREKTTRDQLIVMDDVSGLADESKKFASFPTVACKFNYTCAYIFHIIYPEKVIWRTLLT